MPPEVARQLPAHWPFGIPADSASSDSEEDSGGEGPRPSISIKQADIAQNAVDALNEAHQLNRRQSFLMSARAGTVSGDGSERRGHFFSNSSLADRVGEGEVEAAEGARVDRFGTTFDLVESALGSSGGGSGGGALTSQRAAAGGVRGGNATVGKAGILKRDAGYNSSEGRRVAFGSGDGKPLVSADGSTLGGGSERREGRGSLSQERAAGVGDKGREKLTSDKREVGLGLDVDFV